MLSVKQLSFNKKINKFLKTGAIISIFWMRKLRLRVTLTEHKTTMFQAEFWSPFRVGVCVDM